MNTLYLIQLEAFLELGGANRPIQITLSARPLKRPERAYSSLEHLFFCNFASSQPFFLF